ncbi:MAG: DUF3962 domain-containing protein [Marinisporobacter sp.]|jgi:hypothetical protein|nr:DUF3962 domain-containing protein [Marinisporobacter sp.]
MNKLQLKSYFLKEENIPEYTLYTLNMPKNVEDFINKHFRNERGYLDGIKPIDISKALMVLFPQIVFVTSKVLENSQDPWIYSTEKIDATTIKRVVKDWINQSIKDKKIEERWIFHEEWQWSEGFSSKELMIKKDYMKDMNLLFSIIPALFAFDFCKSPIYFSTIDAHKTFYLACDSNKRECVSDPIRKGRYCFSFVLTFVLKTHRDYENEYFIQPYISVRSWVNQSCFNDNKLILKGGNSRSIYISFDNPFEDQEEDVFIKVSLDRKGYDFDINAKPKFCEKYIDTRFNGFKDVVKDAMHHPKKYSSGEEGKRVWILVSNKDTNMVTANSGPGLPVRKEIHNLLMDKYKLIARKEIEEINIEDVKFKNNEFFFCDDIKHIVLEVYPLERQLIDLVKEVLIKEFQFKKVEENIYTLNDVSLEFKEKDSLDDLLEIGETIEDRCSVLARKLEQYHKSIAVAALIHIGAYHNKDEEIKERDPKGAIRLAMMKTNRVNQFINDLNQSEDGKKKLSEEAKKGKVRNSLLDLLSDLGVLPKEYEKRELHKKVLFGIRTIDKKILLSYIADGKTYCKFYGGDDWKILSKSLLSVSKEVVKCAEIKKIKNRRRATNEFVVKNINEVTSLYKDREIIVCFDASLRNNFWEFAKNNQLDPSKLLIDSPERVKFLRFNQTDEIPDYFIQTEKNKYKDGFNKVVNIVLNENISLRIENKKDKKYIKVSKLDRNINLQELLDIGEYLEECLAVYGIKKIPILIIREVVIDGERYLALFKQVEEKIVMYINDKKVTDSFQLKREVLCKVDVKDERPIEKLTKEEINSFTEKIIEGSTKNTDSYLLIEKDLLNRIDCEGFRTFNKFNFLGEEFEGHKISSRGTKKPIIHSKYMDNKGKGLFSENFSTFYSIGSRPDTMKGVPVNVTKIDLPNKLLSKQRMVEITVAGEYEDKERKELGELGHVLRGLNLTFGFHAEMPLPIFVLNKHRKYIELVKGNK